MERVLVIEDDPAVRKTLKRLFETHGYIVDVVGDGASGLELFRKNMPFAVVLDLRLPDMSGYDVCREITRISPERAIVVLSANSDVFDKVALLEMGARDYVTKPFSPRELLARVRAALRTPPSGPVTTSVIFDDVTVDFSTRQVKRAGTSVFVTRKEYETLQFLVQNAERVVSRQELLDRVWGNLCNLPTRTVDQHILNLRSKLEKDPAQPVHLRTVFRAGYKFVP